MEDFFKLLNFTEDQLKVLRSASWDIYHTLKPIFERKQCLTRSYNSVTDYLRKQDLKYKFCSNYYCFKHDKVIIEIVCRRHSLFSVGIFGFKPSGDIKVLKDLIIADDFLTNSEKDFSNGYQFYGRFGKHEFTQCVELWFKFVMMYIFSIYGLKYEPVYNHMEFIF